MPEEKGLLIVYTGPGKGKTDTADKNGSPGPGGNGGDQKGDDRRHRGIADDWP